VLTAGIVSKCSYAAGAVELARQSSMISDHSRLMLPAVDGLDDLPELRKGQVSVRSS